MRRILATVALGAALAAIPTVPACAAPGDVPWTVAHPEACRQYEPITQAWAAANPTNPCAVLDVCFFSRTEFARIRPGSTWAAVNRAAGCTGRIVGRTDAGGVKYRTVVWDGSLKGVVAARIRFANGIADTLRYVDPAAESN